MILFSSSLLPRCVEKKPRKLRLAIEIQWMTLQMCSRLHLCDMTCSYVWHDSFIRVAWLIHMCDVAHSYVWYDSFICVTWLIQMCDMNYSNVGHDSFMCDITHTYVWRDSFQCVDMTHSNVSCHMLWIACSRKRRTAVLPSNWRIQMFDMTHSNVWHDSFKCATWLIHMCDMTHSNLRHDSFECHVVGRGEQQGSRRHESFKCGDTTPSNLWHDSNFTNTHSDGILMEKTHKHVHTQKLSHTHAHTYTSTQAQTRTRTAFSWKRLMEKTCSRLHLESHSLNLNCQSQFPWFLFNATW